MVNNIGTMDRALRIVAGLACLVAGFAALGGVAKVVALVVGVVLLVTAGMRFCPAYRLLGLRTCRR